MRCEKGKIQDVDLVGQEGTVWARQKQCGFNEPKSIASGEAMMKL